MNYTITEIATIVKAQKRAYKDYTITALLTDSRSLTFPEETLFFALVTERNDGHRYIKDLYRKGVRNFVVEHRVADEELMPEANFIIVKNTLDALQQLAATHRKKFDIPVIGVTERPQSKSGFINFSNQTTIRCALPAVTTLK